MSNIHPNRSILDAQPYLRQTLEIISDKWATSIIYILSLGTRRYSELQSDIGGVSRRMLTRTLRNLERDGIVQRIDYQEQPPRVEYSLTSLGESLVEPLRGICQWAMANFGAVEAARNEADKKSDADGADAPSSPSGTGEASASRVLGVSPMSDTAPKGCKVPSGRWTGLIKGRRRFCPQPLRNAPFKKRSQLVVRSPIAF